MDKCQVCDDELTCKHIYPRGSCRLALCFGHAVKYVVVVWLVIPQWFRYKGKRSNMPYVRLSGVE